MNTITTAKVEQATALLKQYITVEYWHTENLQFEMTTDELLTAYVDIFNGLLTDTEAWCKQIEQEMLDLYGDTDDDPNDGRDLYEVWAAAKALREEK